MLDIKRCFLNRNIVIINNIIIINYLTSKSIVYSCSSVLAIGIWKESLKSQAQSRMTTRRVHAVTLELFNHYNS